jgi:3-phenylpropionate/trans-cinnamate dioxygenase ferredoxin reductase component
LFFGKPLLLLANHASAENGVVQMEQSFVIVGANLAGGRAAEALRREGFDGRIFLVGEEPVRPYERPPLSKEILCNSRAADSLYLRSESFYREHEIDLCLARRVERLDLQRRRVVLSGNEELPATKVLWCTGGRPRQLVIDGATLQGIHYVRTMQHVADLTPHVNAGCRVVIIGMGVIGAEIAASAVKLGAAVVAIEPMPAPMGRIFGKRFGTWLAEKHVRSGVRVILQTRIDRLLGTKGHVRAVMLDDGEIIPADVVVVGIGIEPATELAEAAGINVQAGITGGRQCRTSSEMVWAAGDVTHQPNFFDPNTYVRVETFQNAQEQAAAAAASMLGRPVEYLGPGWFWTDQYDLNIQLCGRISEDTTRIVRGDEAAERFSVFFLRGNIVEGVLTVNRVSDMGVGKRLVAGESAW